MVGVVGSIWRTATAAWHVRHLFWHLSSLLCPFCFPKKINVSVPWFLYPQGNSYCMFSPYIPHHPHSPFLLPLLCDLCETNHNCHKIATDPLKAENPLATHKSCQCMRQICQRCLFRETAPSVVLETLLFFFPQQTMRLRWADNWLRGELSGEGTRSDKDPAFKQNSKRVSLRRLQNQNNQLAAVWKGAHGHRWSVQQNERGRLCVLIFWVWSEEGGKCVFQPCLGFGVVTWSKQNTSSRIHRHIYIYTNSSQ